MLPSRRRDRDPAFKRAIGRQAGRARNGCARFFSAGPPGLCITKQNKRASPSSADASALRFAPGAGPARPTAFVARRPRGSKKKKKKNKLQLYGFRPFQDELDPRPLPEGNAVADAIADIFDALIVTLQDTRLEPNLDDLLWSTVNLFHRATDRIERELDDNEPAQRRSHREQDGSEVKSVELERLTAEGQTLIERRDAFELMRDHTAEHFERHTGIILATAQRIDGEPPHHDLGYDRQPRFSRRQAPYRNRSYAARGSEDRLHRRSRLQRSPAHLGEARSGPHQASGHGAAAWRSPKRR